MKKRFLAMAMTGVMTLGLAGCGGQSPSTGSSSNDDSAATTAAETTAETTTAASTSKAPDYSDKACWYQIPEITKDVDTFFVYPTEYMAANEGDPDFAPLDNAEMLEGVKTNYPILASVYEDSTNVFMPY